MRLAERAGQLDRPSTVTDRQIVALAAAVVAASLLPLDIGALSWLVRGCCVVLGLAAWRLERPLAVAISVVAFTAVTAGVAWSAARSFDGPTSYVGTMQLTTDPEPVSGGMRVRADVDGQVLDIRAWGSPAGWLRPRLMGEVLDVELSRRPLRDPPSWLLAQGVRGRATLASVTGYTEGAIHTRIANSLRRTIESGAASLTRDERALFTGLVYGDDRAQTPLTRDDFDAAGLSHLVAVSGQNVAFVLALAGPLLRRIGHRQRWCAIGALLLLFATMTRFEPSVVRASAMAAVASTGALVGTAVPSARVLLLAVTGLIACRPMLIHSVAFQLSVAASAGILLWSGRLARAVPGPRPLVEAIAVTVAAQLAVSPLLLWRFGAVPVAALPANLLAGPASGPVMMWGMTGGWLAGLVPAPIATVLHLPTRLGVQWIAGVARWSAALPTGELGWIHITVIGVALCGCLRTINMRRRALWVAIACAALSAPTVALVTSSPRSATLESGTTIVADPLSGSVAVTLAGEPQQVLADIRRADVDAITLLVVDRSSFERARLVDWLQTRHRIATVWAPTSRLGVGEVVPSANERHQIGPVSIGPLFEGSRLSIARVASAETAAPSDPG